MAPLLANIEAVIFDLDGTLLDRRRSFERFVGHQWERFADVLEGVGQLQYVETLTELDRDGYGPRAELFTGTCARFGLPPELSETLLRDYRTGFPGACVLFDDAVQTLATIRSAGFKLGLITNGSSRMQTAKLQCLALEPAFDTILISSEEGVSKPDPEIFRRAVDRLHTAADRAVFVGDHLEVDISGARGAGMKGVWRRDHQVASAMPPARHPTTESPGHRATYPDVASVCFPQLVEADAVIDELRDLLPLLGLPGRAEISRHHEGREGHDTDLPCSSH